MSNKSAAFALQTERKRGNPNMRSLLGIVAGIVVYVIAVFLILLFFYWFFDKPNEWPYLIPIATAVLSLAIATTTAETISDKKRPGVMVAVLIAAFWIVFVAVDIIGDISDILFALTGRNHSNEVGTTELSIFVLDEILSSKIFAVVSSIVAFGSFEERVK